MRNGLTSGAAARVDAIVTREMTAQLGGQPVHPILATARMIEWMEWAGRRLIVPYLEDREEAVGSSITVHHLAPTRVGEAFWAIARFAEQDGRRLLADVEARNTRGLIGQGRFVQTVLDREDLARRFGLLPP